MARRKSGRNINGVLILDKSPGISSNAALQRIRRLYKVNKAGHTGSLDPLATGVLPICFGEATKFSQYLLNADKAYRVKVQFGLLTDTYDIDGQVIETRDASAIAQSQVEEAMLPLTGDIEQVPPMYSALKQDGQPLYKLARQGIEIERKPRPVTIKDFRLLEFHDGEQASAIFEVECTKGTYIRSLVFDLGNSLGCGASVAELRRISSGDFNESHIVREPDLVTELGEGDASVLDRHLLPMECLMGGFNRVDLEPATAEFFMLGQAVMLSQAYRFGAEADIVRVFREEGDFDNTFLGAGEITGAALSQPMLQPKRLRSDI